MLWPDLVILLHLGTTKETPSMSDALTRRKCCNNAKNITQKRFSHDIVLMNYYYIYRDHCSALITWCRNQSPVEMCYPGSTCGGYKELIIYCEGWKTLWRSTREMQESLFGDSWMKSVFLNVFVFPSVYETLMSFSPLDLWASYRDLASSINIYLYIYFAGHETWVHCAH